MALQRSLLTTSAIDQALRRILKVRLKLGEFDPPEMCAHSAIPKSVINSAAHRSLALQAAEQSVVLLENRAETLPFDETQSARVAVIGPNANVSAFGNYAGSNDQFTTVLQGVRKFDADVSYAKGCNISDLVRQSACTVIIPCTCPVFMPCAHDL